MGIKLLDCTLRDGGHQNRARFGEKTIQDIITGLQRAHTDYIEIGFLRNDNIGQEFAASDSIIDLEERFCKNAKGNSLFTVMIQEDLYDIKKLPKYSGNKIRNIRVSFHDYDKNEGLDFCKGITRLGYQCSVNPINIIGYSDREILSLIDRINEMDIFTFTLVDTFGSMTKDDLIRLYMLVDNNLKKETNIGFHFHDNLQMAYSLAQTVTEMVSDKRNVIIDGSLLGMGREPGNLCIELMMEYLNKKNGHRYDVDEALDLIDAHIAILKEKYPWKYETAYSLSAQYRVHRSYAEYLMKQQKLKTKQIKQILARIEKDKMTRYDERYIEKLYHDVVATEIDDCVFREKLRIEIGDKKVLLIAPGSSLIEYMEEVQAICNKEDFYVITANFTLGKIETDRVFCSNIKRLDRMKEIVPIEKIILSAYLSNGSDNCVNTNELGWFGNFFWDNCMLMLLHLIKKIGINECYIAGWDGFKSSNNFVDEEMEFPYSYEDENEKVIKILQENFRDMTLHFNTPSLYTRVL